VGRARKCAEAEGLSKRNAELVAETEGILDLLDEGLNAIVAEVEEIKKLRRDWQRRSKKCPKLSQQG